MKSQFFTTVSAALAMQSAPGEKAHVEIADAANSTSAPDEFHSTGTTTQTPDVISTIAEGHTSHESPSFSMEMHSPPEWRSETASRYSELVDKEALREILAAEEQELEQLQRLRRRELNPPLGEEILLRYQREKLDQGMLNLVKRYVRFQVPKGHKKRNAP